jgi:hypothetical protein
LKRSCFSRTLEAIEVHFTPEQEAQLAQIAMNAVTDAGLPRCVCSVPASNPIPKAGQREITSILAAGRCVWLSKEAVDTYAQTDRDCRARNDNSERRPSRS